MNSSRPDLSPAAEEQASLWAARLEGAPLTAADRAALDAWLAENSAHRAWLSDYCQFSADLEQELPALVAAGIITMPAPSRATRRSGKLKWGVTWAALAAAAVVTFVFWPARRFDRIATPVGQRQSITLGDGTRVELNAHTNLLIGKVRGTERRVRLVDGEAFFSVAKDKTRPFIVETPAGSVRVTGTVFDVRSETASQLEVTVVEGSVQVRPGDRFGASANSPVVLGAGDHLMADDNGVEQQALPASDLSDALAWREGAVVFNHVSLADALARFARYHGRSIQASAGAASLTLTGRYNLDDLDGFLTTLQNKADLPVRVATDASGNTRVTLRNEP
jgi:transmembrane sensor